MDWYWNEMTRADKDQDKLGSKAILRILEVSRVSDSSNILNNDFIYLFHTKRGCWGKRTVVR